MDAEPRYELLSILGEGGFGRVYRARVRGLDGFEKQVAIKVLTDPNPEEEILQRFRDEARLLGLVRDRAVVTVDAPTRIGGRWAVVMELADGASCRELLQQGVFPPGVACEIVGEVARALHALYNHAGPDGSQLHLLHRDIKPDNIQIAPSGSVKILDFGIAKAAFSTREAATGHLIGGTVGYIAPERLEGEDGPEADIYSLGVVLHQLVTGHRPSLTSRNETSFVRGGDPAHDNPAPVIELASRMRALEPHLRPVAREVERECRALRAAVGGPWLSDWAEQHVPARTESESRPLQGELYPVPPTGALQTTGSVLSGTTALSSVTIDTHKATQRSALVRRAGPIAGALLVTPIALLGLLGLGIVSLIAVISLVIALSSSPTEVAARAPAEREEVPQVAPAQPAQPAAPAPGLVPAAADPVAADPVPVAPREDRAPQAPRGPAPLPRPSAVSPSEPPPAAPPAEEEQTTQVQTWRIVVLSDPLGLDVEIDARGRVGKTPLAIELPSGKYTVRVAHESKQGTTEIRVGKNMPLTYAWTASDGRWSSGY